MIYEEKIRLPFPDNECVQGILAYPEKVTDKRAVLLCSPHPHFAGNMDNNVICALYEFISEKGLPVLRFNYRGVGESELNLPDTVSLFNYWEEVEEKKLYTKPIEDTLACLDYLAHVDKGLKISLIGYSFGEIMVMLAGKSCPDIKQITLVAPPLSEYDFSLLSSLVNMNIFVIGSEGDFVYDRAKFLPFCQNIKTINDYEFFEDCDHFFLQKEEKLVHKIWNFMNRSMK